MFRVRKSAQRSTRGNVILESALVFIVFFSMFIGIFDFGQFLFLHQALVERAQWAAREGVAQSYSTDQIKNMVLYGNSSGTGSAYYNMTSSMVTVNSLDSGTNNARVQVMLTNYPYTMFTPLSAGSYRGPDIVVVVPTGMYD